VCVCERERERERERELDENGRVINSERHIVRTCIFVD